MGLLVKESPLKGAPLQGPLKWFWAIFGGSGAPGGGSGPPRSSVQLAHANCAGGPGGGSGVGEGAYKVLGGGGELLFRVL